MLSILIVNWNTKQLLISCLKSIEKYPPSDSFEVIVVDNDSQDGSADAIRTEFPSVRLIAHSSNSGYAAGNNIAFANASGSWLLTLNPDTEATASCFDVAIERLRQFPKCGALGIKLVHPDGRTQQSVRGFPTLRGLLGEIFKFSDDYRKANLDYDKEQLVDQPMGTFLLFRRDALTAVGDAQCPFDNQFPIFFNEVDLLFRLSKAGWPCLYTPLARIVHHGGESTKLVRKSMIWESHRSLLRYLRKHVLRGGQLFIIPFLALTVYTSAFVRARGYSAGFRP